MHGDVGAALGERDFEFLEEQALAADLRERAVEDAVAARRHRQQLDAQVGMHGAQAGGDVVCLPQGERALARGDSEDVHRGILSAGTAAVSFAWPAWAGWPYPPLGT